MGANMMQFLARGWLILELTDSPFYVGLAAAAGGLPMLLFSMVGGVLADRFNRRTVLLVGETANLALFILLAMLIAAEVVEVWHVLAVAFLSGIAFAVGMPSRQALMATLVPREDVGNAIALSTGMFSLSQVVGPAIAGVLVSFAGIATTFAVTAVALVPAIGLLVTLAVPATPQPHDDASPLERLAAGFSYVRGNPLIRTLILMGGIGTLFAMPREALMPVFARDVLGAGSQGLGLLLGANGLGACAGSLLLAATGDSPLFRRLALGSSLAVGLAVVAFALSSSLALSLVLSAVAGLMNQLFLATNFTVIQLAVPDDLRGRVLSIRMVIFGLMPIGSLAAGAIAELAGAPATIAAGGAICAALMAVVLLRTAEVREIGKA
jgi:MFS family permease